MVWDAMLPGLVGAGVGGAAAIAGAFLAQQYQSLLVMRTEHRDDLKKEVLEPWGEECDGLLEVVMESGRGLVGFIRVGYDQGYYTRPPGFHPGLADLDSVWGESRKHWPSLHMAWEDVCFGFHELSLAALDLFTDASKAVHEPEWGWPHRHPTNPEYMPWTVAAKCWDSFWFAHASTTDDMQELFRKNVIRDYPLTKDEGSDEYLERLAQVMTSVFFGDDGQRRVKGILDQVSLLRVKLTMFKHLLKACRFDRILPGKCGYSPRILGGRVRRYLVRQMRAQSRSVQQPPQ